MTRLMGMIATGLIGLAMTASAQEVVIVDNDGGSPGYTETGTWSTSGSPGYNGGTYRFANAGSAATATWTGNLTQTDQYNVGVWYRDGSNRTTSTRYEIQTATGTEVVTISQTGSGLDWVSLGTFDFNPGAATVTLDAAGSTGGSVVISDAVRFYQGGEPPPPPPTVLETETIEPGIVYTKYQIGGPVIIHVLEFDLAEPDLTLEMDFALGRRNYGSSRERPSSIANRNDTAGHDVIAAINAAFFGAGIEVRGGTWAADDNLVTLPDFTSAHDVWMLQDNDETWVARRPFFPATVDAIVEFESGATIDVARLNYTCDGDYAIYTRQWNTVTGIGTQGVEVVVEGVNFPLRPEKIQRGLITQIRTGAATQNSSIPAGGFLLRACSAADAVLLANANVGDPISLEIELGPPQINQAAVLQHARGILVDDFVASPESWIYADSFARHPRTVIAANGSTHYFIVFDGRSTASIGVGVDHMADFLVSALGVEFAANVDGGGSSVLWIDGSIYNVPSDGTERSVVNAIMLVREDMSSALPIDDDFPSTGRTAPWIDKFSPNEVVPFAPAADGHALEVRDPDGGHETVSIGGPGDADYVMGARIHCDHRPGVAGDGFERVGIFARDDGNGNFTSAHLGGGNCYGLTFDTDTGRIRAFKMVDGVMTDFTDGDPILMPSDAWRLFQIRCEGSEITFFVDGQAIATVNDTAHVFGAAGIGHHEMFVTDSNALGTHADTAAMIGLDALAVSDFLLYR